MNYFTDAIKRYAEFTGRATRTQYWMYILFYVIFYIVLAILERIIGTNLLTLIYSLALFVPTLAIGARRLHDTGKSGWWLLIGLIPIVGAIVLIIFFVQPSQGDNEFGPAPRLA